MQVRGDVDNSIGIGDLAAILTVGGVTIYVLGLIGLAIPIRRQFTRDLSAAWYTVALIPKTVVAGQGARLWLRWPAILTTLILLATPLQFLFSTNVYVLVTLAILTVGGSPAGGIAFPLFVEASQKQSRSYLRVLVIAVGLIILLLGGVVGGVLGVVGSFMLIGSSPDFIQEIPYLTKKSHPFIGFLLLFITSFLFGLPSAISAAAPLPEVRITKRDKGENVQSPTTGYLVAHSDGFWHLFDEHYSLLSIPDDQVSSVEVVSDSSSLLP